MQGRPTGLASDAQHSMAGRLNGTLICAACHPCALPPRSPHNCIVLRRDVVGPAVLLRVGADAAAVLGAGGASNGQRGIKRALAHLQTGGVGGRDCLRDREWLAQQGRNGVEWAGLGPHTLLKAAASSCDAPAHRWRRAPCQSSCRSWPGPCTHTWGQVSGGEWTGLVTVRHPSRLLGIETSLGGKLSQSSTWPGPAWHSTALQSAAHQQLPLATHW